MKLLDFSEDDPKVLVWFDTAFLGDMVLLSASMRQAHKIWPNCKQYLISNSPAVQVLEGLEFLRGFLIINKGADSFFTTRNKIKNFIFKIGCEYRTSFLMLSHRSARSFFLTSFLGIRRIGFRSFGLFSLKYSVPYVGIFHEIKRKVLLLERFNKSRAELFSDLRPVLNTNPDLCREGIKTWVLQAKKTKELLVSIAPGSVWATKEYLKEYFVAVIEKILNENSNASIVLLGGNKDITSASYIFESLLAKKIDKNRILNTVGDTTLGELKYLISQSDVLICNDSAPTHIASAFDIPTVTIFGPTVKEFGFSSLSSRHVSLGVDDLYCRPCGNHGHQQCPEKHFRCMRDLSPDVVVNAFRNLLE